MIIGSKLRIVALAATLGALIVPAMAQNDANGNANHAERGMSMDHMGQGMMHGDMMHGGMMHGGMMSGNMMAGGCSEMMQSMRNGGGRPNSQWQQHPPGDATPN